MANRKRRRDFSQLAQDIVDEATREDRDQRLVPDEPENPDQVLGGKKGGKARAKKLSPEKRSEIARKAARARWGQGDSTDST